MGTLLVQHEGMGETMAGNVTIAMEFSDNESVALHREAAKAGINLDAWMRIVLLARAPAFPPWPDGCWSEDACRERMGCVRPDSDQGPCPHRQKPIF